MVFEKTVFAGAKRKKRGARDENDVCVWLLGLTHRNYTEIREHVDPSDKRQCHVQACWDMRLLNLSMGRLLLGEYIAAAHVACAHDCKTRSYRFAPFREALQTKNIYSASDQSC